MRPHPLIRGMALTAFKKGTRSHATPKVSRVASVLPRTTALTTICCGSTPNQAHSKPSIDNDGHILHYDVTRPDASTAQTLTDPSTTGPQFRPIY